MRTAFVAILPAVLLGAAWAAPAVAETKIGAINIPALLRDSPQVRSANEKFKAEFQKREDDLVAEGKKLEDDIGRFRREADTLSPQQRTSTQNDLNTRKTNFEVKQRQFGEQAAQRKQEFERGVLEKVNQAITEVAKEKGIDVVVRDPAYADPALDITPDVLKKLATYQAAPPAAEPKKNKK